MLRHDEGVTREIDAMNKEVSEHPSALLLRSCCYEGLRRHWALPFAIEGHKEAAKIGKEAPPMPCGA
jgi:hypothetical protein